MSKYFTTDDTALATYLYMKGVTIMEGTTTNPAHRKRRMFIFINEPKVKSLQHKFYGRTATVIPLDYQEARAHISRFLKLDVAKPERFLDDTI